MATEIISKRCSRCKEIKSLSEFHRDKSQKDGLKSYCKSCHKAYNQSERNKAYQKSYAQSPEGKIAHKRYAQSKKGKTRQNRFFARHPNYTKAMSTVNDAVKAGKLSRPDTLPCHYCPKQAQQYHHHKGYDPEHWLDVLPACRDCHSKLHRKTG